MLHLCASPLGSGGFIEERISEYLMVPVLIETAMAALVIKVEMVFVGRLDI